ncbi:MAG: hypothetical protein FJ385_05670 [Verrucomicrobia bacterium]|nr:hypothetical protein [Verrucomicrobiota bacterium]
MKAFLAFLFLGLVAFAPEPPDHPVLQLEQVKPPTQHRWYWGPWISDGDGVPAGGSVVVPGTPARNMPMIY